MHRRLLSLALFLPASIVIACGSDVDAEQGAGGSSSVATSATSSDATSVSSATTTVVSSATTGAGGGQGCANASDEGILGDPNLDIDLIVGDCAQANHGKEPETSECIQAGTGLSDECMICYGLYVQCTIEDCLMECVGDSSTQPCIECRAAKCVPDFEACAGVSPG